ncbi:CheR family methyltransferase [Marinilabilia rubra]|uniref:protein-glutamate O-methyltransferase n=1 Tax=Marinilabilia rubra TaxID=2162893 RepID=A0A2U2B9P5_9BACT|nr:CheR family methyltransferase [Marinilabilia rubra]PWD99774.1 chemotaxis protein CheR [Marinilabilia rubra]
MSHSKVEEAIPVVAIGASAGGLEALQAFFKVVPPEPGVAFVVIQHLSPDYKSFMDELLGRITTLDIQVIEDGTQLKTNTIFLIPPRKNLSLFHNQLFLEDQSQRKSLHLPVDIFFRSLASERGKDAIGIILSGTGSDGTLGTKAIKEYGGMIMVQDEESSKFDGMPRNTIATGLTDYILPPEKMPEALLGYLKHPFIEKSSSIDSILKQETDVLSKILMILRDYSGADFSFYKEKTITRRLERRLSVNHFQTLEEYLELLSESDKEKEILYRELLIGVTSFFRDPEAFESIRKNILPELLKQSDKKTLRIWVAATSTGEEAYSIAILVMEYLKTNGINTDLKIFATDIDNESIEIAGQGFYPESIVADVSPEILAKYFEKNENGYKVSEGLRKKIIFATHNILKDPPFSKIDLISCRNLFIYLKPQIQEKIYSTFYFSLKSKSFLFVGASESLGNMQSAFTPVDSKWKLFRAREGFKPPFAPNIPHLRTSSEKPTKSQSPVTDKTSHNHVKLDKMLEMIIHDLLPPSVIIDENFNLIHVINNINDYINLPSGKFTNNFLSLLNEDLRMVVSGLLRQLRTENQTPASETLKNAKGFPGKLLRIETRRLNQNQDSFKYFIVSFTEKEIKNDTETQSSEERPTDLNEKQSEAYYELEKELQYTKETLQATVEELETSNEELQSSNEELIASNEELQSTNEELQSVNEELYTVNSEHQDKIEELTKLNNDINNLLKNTDIGTLFLDSHLCIRKFTPVVSKLTNIIEMDIGRPIHHISVPENYGAFIEDIKKVLNDLQPVEKEICDNSGQWHLVKIMPYRTEENAVDGIIITFVNISTLKKETKRADIAAARLEQAMDAGKMAWWEWDIPSGNVTYDDKKATMLGYHPDEFPNQIYKITELIHPEDFESSMQAMRDHLAGKKENYEVTYRIKRKDNTYGRFFDKGGVVAWDETGKPLKLTGIVADVSSLNLQQKA